jgi:hypothetical protein
MRPTVLALGKVPGPQLSSIYTCTLGNNSTLDQMPARAAHSHAQDNVPSTRKHEQMHPAGRVCYSRVPVPLK